MSPTTETLTAERILEATEEVLRRHGPAKATVVDVARALGVSHGSVYRHFRTKAALREAVTQRWLDRTAAALAGFVTEERDPEARLRDWLRGLFDAKRHKACDDPELFATFSVLTGENSGVVDQHIAELTAQLAEIVRDGVARGAFTAGSDPAVTARAIFQATGRFHDPAYAGEWRRPGVEEEFAAVVDLLMRGLRAADGGA
ncbi:TetR family transcriptional regulator [Streptomyces hygroscopicus]|uniref:TetR family transcriptional regulator n=1 Tax=Streptomyces hygroscopicus TaxID=1912 RepID=UPI00223F827E|nr:TetR family transcriptional regulator [Streptomyces hygroscopicus]MCW7943544.1 TetR family transcriptional regulator [Streptomyces hygroscopicus]